MNNDDERLSVDLWSLVSDAEIIEHANALESLMNSGSSRAALLLSVLIGLASERSDSIKKELKVSSTKINEIEKEAVKHLLAEASKGDGHAMHNLAVFYQCGRGGLPRDGDKFVDWNERALAANYFFAANDLYSVYSERGKYHNPQRAKEMLSILKKHACCVVVSPEKSIREDGQANRPESEAE